MAQFQRPIHPGLLAPHPGLPVSGGLLGAMPAFRALFGGQEDKDGKPRYTAKDVLDAQREAAKQFDQPIQPVYRGIMGGGLAAFGNPFVKMMMLGDARNRSDTNEQVRREAIQSAMGAANPQDRMRALSSSGHPELQGMALTAQMAQDVKDRERELQAAIAQRVYGPTGGASSAAPSQAPMAQPAPQPAQTAQEVPAPAPPNQLRTTWPFPTDAPPVAQTPPAPPPSLPNTDTDFMMPPAPSSGHAPPALRPQHLTPEGVSQEQIDRLPLNRPTAPAPMPPTPPLATLQQPQAAPQSEPIVQIGEVRLPLSEARRRYARGLSEGMSKDALTPLADAISLAETGPRAAATETARAQAQAQGGLAQAVNSAQSTIEKLDEIATDPQLERLIGWAWYNPAGYLPDNPQQKALRARISQVQGRFFLQAFDALRGSGQISNVEGEKAQESIARIMNTDQDIDSYRTAIEDARREIWALTNTARTRAGLPAVPYQPAAPAVGSIREGHRFNGGNPADRSSWQRAQ